MSNTLVPLLESEPLQLAFLQAGEFNRFLNGTRVQKAIPYTIVAQAVEGTYEVRCNGQHQKIESGGVFIIPTHAPVEITHWMGKRGVMAARWLHLRFSLWGMIDFLSLYEIPLQLPEPASRKLGKIMGKVLKLQNNPNDETAAMILRNELALQALRWICDSAKAKESPLFQGQQRLRGTLQYIQQHLAEKITVALLAKMAHLSAAQFHAIFQQEFGVSPMRYVRNIRLDNASRQLTTPDRTLSEIAESIGFSDPFHFSHAFKAQFGISPRDYRRQLATGALYYHLPSA